MNGLPFFLVLLLSCFTLTTCAQTRIVVARVKGYYMIPIPGTIPVDDNGEQLNLARDTIFLVYVETKESNLRWEKAWKGGRSFSVTSTPVKEAKVTVGETKAENKKIELTASGKNKLWQLQLFTDQKNTKPPQSLKKNELLLKGRSNQQIIYHKSSSWTELSSPLYQ